MKTRSDNRLAISRQVRVFGMDSQGIPFSQHALTLDVSLHGARIQGIEHVDLAGQVIGLSHRDEKARFRVVWVGKADNPGEQQIGLSCVDHGAYIWDIFPPVANDTVEADGMESPMTSPSQIPPHARRNLTSRLFRMTTQAPVRERRSHPRFPIGGSAELRTLAANSAEWAILYDLSATGCYLEARCPWPSGNCVRIIIDTGGIRFQAKARVVTSHLMVGMGLRFLEITQVNRQRLEYVLASFQQECRRDSDRTETLDGMSSEDALTLARHLSPG